MKPDIYQIFSTTLNLHGYIFKNFNSYCDVIVKDCFIFKNL